jgi:hypothetical protein
MHHPSNGLLKLLARFILAFATMFFGSALVAACGGDASVIGGAAADGVSHGETDDTPTETTVALSGVVTTTAPATVTGARGTAWSYSCGTQGVSGSLRVPYTNAAAIALTLTGTNLNTINAVGIGSATTASASGYRVTMTRQTTTEIGLDLRALNEGPSGTQPATLTIALRTTSGATITRAVSVIPTYSVGGQSYGQCTTLAWYRTSGRVTSYAQGRSLSADSASADFPRGGDALMTSGAGHMIYLSRITLAAGSTTTRRTYSLDFEEWNFDCRGGYRTITSTAVATRVGTGPWTWSTRPATSAATFVNYAR